MTQDEKALVNSSSGGGGNNNGDGGGDNNAGDVSGYNKSSTKSNKSKKIPRRGLGIAQLEKRRLEKLKEKIAADSQSGNSSDFPNDPISYLPVQRTDLRLDRAPTLRNYWIKQSTEAPNASFRSPSSSRGVEIPRQGSIVKANQLNLGGLETSIHGDIANLWDSSGFFNLEEEMSHYLKFGQPHQISVPFIPFHGVPKRQNDAWQPFTAATGNISSGISQQLLLSLQIEPPSNQSSLGNSNTPSFSAKDEIVGKKRLYPFSPETSSTPYAPRSSSGELTIKGGHKISPVETRNKYIREGQLSSTPLPEPSLSKLAKLNGDLPTVALPSPSVSSLPVMLRNKNSMDHSDQTWLQMSVPESRSQVYEEHVTGQVQHQLGPGQSRSPAPTSSFFSAKSPENQSTTDLRSENGEKDEPIDLNLRL